MDRFDWFIPFFDLIEVRWVDLVEVALFAYLLYKLYQFMRGTIAVQIFLGLIALYFVQVVVSALDMTIFRALFGSLSQVFVLAVIILFQPEIRRLLLLLGQNRLIRRFVSSSPVQDAALTEVVEAAGELSRTRTGALIAFERATGLRSYIETGTTLHARVSRDLLIAIFYGKNPLHDGAVIVQDRFVEAARCILPVSSTMALSPHLGLRHRAAVGLTEQTDAFVVVVSEETGNISVSKGGDLLTNLTTNELRGYLAEALTLKAVPAEDDLAASEA